MHIMRTRLTLKEVLASQPVAPLANSGNPEMGTRAVIDPAKAEANVKARNQELEKKQQAALAKLTEIRAALSAMVLKSMQLNKLIKPEAPKPPTVAEQMIPQDKAKQLVSFVNTSILPRVKKELATGNPQAPEDPTAKKTLMKEVLNDIRNIEDLAGQLEALIKTFPDREAGMAATTIGGIPVSLNQAEKIITSLLLGNKEVSDIQAFKELLNGIDSAAGKVVQTANLLGGLTVLPPAVK